MSSEILALSGAAVAKCMQCGRCSASCPAGAEMDLRPHQAVSRLRGGDVDALLEAESIWLCMSCFGCVDRCPRDVKPAGIMEAARITLLRRQNEVGLNVDDIPSLLDSEGGVPQQLLVSAFRKYRK